MRISTKLEKNLQNVRSRNLNMGFNPGDPVVDPQADSLRGYYGKHSKVRELRNS